MARSRSLRLLAVVAGLLIAAGVAMFFAHAATVHGKTINISKARGDQSGYLMDAEFVYANYHGARPRHLIGERNRMPLYAGYLALFYNPSMTDPEYFEVGKAANISLALVLLALLGVVLWWHLPRLAAINLLGIATFGWYIYKAAYTQSELLFYTFFFLQFLACWHLLRMKATPTMVSIGALAGGLATLAYLTKAATPPFLAIFGAAFVLRGLASNESLPPSQSRRSAVAWTVLSGVMFAVVFLGALSPYLKTNKKHFDRYFYNVNSTFYVWYDDWASASVGVRLHDDNKEWPQVPASAIPSAGRYWREHTVRQIAERIWSGLQDMASVSYRTYDYLAYLLLFAAVLLAVAATRWREVSQMMRDRVWLTLFLLAYFALYGLATAFYFPISGTGTGRFLIAHLLPYFFVLTHVFTRSRLAGLTWSIGPASIRVGHLQWLVLTLLILDVSFRTWPRMMSTYGGF